MVATLDFALAAEDRSFTSPELRANLDRLLAPRDDGAGHASRPDTGSRERTSRGGTGVFVQSTQLYGQG